jgi:CheY-like chemotaxis protein
MARRHLLVVDPSPTTLSRVAQALSGSGFLLSGAKDIAEAEEISDREDLAAVISALSFPRGNGYDLARHVRARHPQAAVFLLAGGFEVYDPRRAQEAGVSGRLGRPVHGESLRGLLEAAFGPLRGPGDLPEDEAAVDSYEGEIFAAAEDPSPGIPEPRPPGKAAKATPVEVEEEPPPTAPAAAVGDERLATFLPRDWKTHPPVVVKAAEIAPGLERAILEVLPQVVEAVMAKAFHGSPAFKEMVAVAADEAVRAHLPRIAQRVIRERLLELEAQGDEEE